MLKGKFHGLVTDETSNVTLARCEAIEGNRKIFVGIYFDSKCVDKIICWIVWYAVLLEFRLLEFLPMCIYAEEFIGVQLFPIEIIVRVLSKIITGIFFKHNMEIFAACWYKQKKRFDFSIVYKGLTMFVHFSFKACSF